MIQCDLTAVGNHTVDEAYLLRMQEETAVTLLQLFLTFCRQLLDHPVVNIVLMQGDNGQTPTCRSEIFREGIDAKGVFGQFRHDGTKVRDVCGINIVRDDHQIGIIVADNVDNTLHQLRRQTVRRRIARVDKEGGLDGGIFQDIEVFFLILPGVIALVSHFAGMDFGYIEQVAGLFRNLYVGSEYRGKQNDLISAVQQEILLEGIEDIAHGCRPSFCRKEIEPAFRRAVIA